MQSYNTIVLALTAKAVLRLCIPAPEILLLASSCIGRDLHKIPSASLNAALLYTFGLLCIVHIHCAKV